jgi:choice-of-anchor A domain-containing protein
MLFRRSKSSRRKRGYTLMEILISIAAITTVSSSGLVFYWAVIPQTGNTKLQSDIRQLNSAIATYRAHGGNLDGVTTPEAVVEKLKTVARTDGGKDKELTGLKNSMVDPRLQVVRSEKGKPKKEKKGARYNPEKQQFEMAPTNAGNTIEAFELGSAGESVQEDRTALVRGSKDSGWVWDYGDKSGSRGPLRTPTTANPADSDAPGTTLDTPSALTPILSPAASPSELNSYPLLVTIRDSNAANSTQLYYSINGSTFAAYKAPVTIAPGTTLRAVAASLDPDHLQDSGLAQQFYSPAPVKLSLADNAPAAVSYFEVGGTAAAGSPAVALRGPSAISLSNASAIPSRFQSSSYFQVERALAGVTAYSAPFSNGYPGESFSITRAAFGSNPTIALSYRAVSLDSVFDSSTPVSKTVGINRLTLQPPLITANSSQVSLAANFSSAVPSGYRIYYKFDSDPGDNQGEPASGTLYQAAVTAPANGGTLYARAFPPSASKLWFNTSAVASLVIPAQSTTNYMGDFNVIVFTNLYTTTAIEGKSWIGGNLTNGNSFSLGRNYSPSAAENVVVVGGSPGSGNAISMEGNSNSRLALTSTLFRGNRHINWNGGGNEASRLVYDATIPARTLIMQAELQAMSRELSTAAATSTVITPVNQSNKRVLTCTPNASGVAVFNIAASSLFGAANLAEVTLGFAAGVSESSVKGVLINVTGTTVQTGNQFNFGGKFTDDNWRKKILWNFPATQTMNMAAQRMDGAVLAPYASVTSNNDFKGSLACKALNLSGTCFRLPFASAEILTMGR